MCIDRRFEPQRYRNTVGWPSIDLDHVVVAMDMELGVVRVFLHLRYEDAVERHDQIQANLATAKMSSRLESEQLGEKFTLIDPPRIPGDPASPNRVGILALGIVLAGALSIAALALAEISDGSVRNSRDIVELLGMPPLAAIPLVETHSDRRARFVRIIAHASFAGLMVSSAAAGVWFLSA